MQIIDTHTHLYFSHFDRNRAQVIDQAKKAGVTTQIQIGCDEISSLAAVDLAEKSADFFATIGLHPCDVAPLFEGGFENHRIAGFEHYERTAHNLDELFEFFEDLHQKSAEKIVGFGETGFDRYHDKRSELVAWQADSLVRHLQLCQKFNKPVVIHTRNSTRELLDFLAQNAYFFRGDNAVRGVVHCFAEDWETAKILTEQYGMYLGLGGVVTYDRTETLAEAVRRVDPTKLLTETDSPFLAPKNFRAKYGRINTSAALPEVVEAIATIRQEPVEKMAETLVKNAQTLFGI